MTKIHITRIQGYGKEEMEEEKLESEMNQDGTISNSRRETRNELVAEQNSDEEM